MTTLKGWSATLGPALLVLLLVASAEVCMKTILVQMCMLLNYSEIVKLNKGGDKFISLGTCVISALWNADRRKLNLKVKTTHCGGKRLLRQPEEFHSLTDPYLAAM